METPEERPGQKVITDVDVSPPRGNPFPIVGIGGSAGGLDAMMQLLRSLPPDTGMAFVMILHLDPNHDSQLAALLAPATKMPVITVSDGMKIVPDNVYVLPPNYTLVIEGDRLKLSERRPGPNLPVDIFFRSLAQVQGSRGIGVVLSGNASDGSAGIKAIKSECGVTFAQDEATAKFSGMPRAAIATGAVDYVADPATIASELAHVGHHPYLVSKLLHDGAEEILPEGDSELSKIFALLQAATKVDFTHYKINTVRRRIGRRMMVHRTERLGDYAHLLEQNRAEVGELYRDLLISVTSFFRDPASMDALRQILTKNLQGRSSDNPFRVWVPGCATGEEVYSHAICLHEILRALQLHVPLQLFGTDISEVALERARAGIYSDIVVHDVPQDLLQRYFVNADSGHQIAKMIRESCVFARQDLTKDPPFSNLDLVSCRNVLIYLDSTLQRRVLPIFHYSLNPEGILMLGSAETVSAAPDLFSVIDKQHCIFARKDAAIRLTLDLALNRTAAREPLRRALSTAQVDDLQRRVDRVIQNKYTPDGVVVDSELRVLQFRGHTSFYLERSPGEAIPHLLHMARESLVVPLRRLMQQVINRNTSARELGVVVEHGGDRRQIDIEVTAIVGPAREKHYLVIFDELPRPAVISPEEHGQGTTDSPQVSDIQQLERELAEAREFLRNLSEDHETHVEELRSAKEEIRSANEELQSTNEELSTTKEELQSANEELTIVNEELHTRNHELSSINSDLKNLLGAVNLPIIMIDNDLRLRRFTTASEKLLGLSASDMGRQLASVLAVRFPQNLEVTTRAVINDLRSEHIELQDKHGSWYSVSIRPYRTIDNRIDGAVITFVDIDTLKRNLTAAEEARDYAEAMIETVREPLVVLDGDLRVQRATSAFYEVFHVTREETIGRLLYDLGNGQWNQPRLRELLGNALYRNEPFVDHEVEHTFPYIGKHTMRLNARRIPRDAEPPRTLLLAIEDVTDRREQAYIQYRRLFETAKDGMLILDAETEVVMDVNPFMLNLIGYSREEVIGRSLDDIPAFRAEAYSRLVEEVCAQGTVRYDDVPTWHRDETSVDSEIISNRYQVGGRTVIQANIRDAGPRKRTETALRESEERFRTFVESVYDYALFQSDLNGRIVSWNVGAERLLGFKTEEIIGQSTALVFTPEDVAAGQPKKEMEQARLEGRAEDERWHVRKDGTRFFASGVLTQVRNGSGHHVGYAKIMRDNTVRKRADEELRNSLREKEILLKEVHHRVKNNLQVVTSLLSLQADRLTDPGAVIAMGAMRNRVHTIAAIHELLYRSGDLSRINFSEYVRRLAHDLMVFHDVDPETIDLSISREEAFLDLSQAVPAGLLINELLTNAFKHAFSDGGSGRIGVTVSCDDGVGRIEVADTGKGLPVAASAPSRQTMGMQLVSLLAEQLEGEVTLDSTDGTRFEVIFPCTPK